MTTEMTYRRSSLNGASPIGLIIALFDTLVGDFRRAAEAIHIGDIEARCKETNHGLLVLGQLESWVDLKAGGESASALSRFYSYLRAKIMEASMTRNAKVLESTIDMILHVRTSWQQLDSSNPETPQASAAASSEAVNAGYASGSDSVYESSTFSQSA